MARRARDSFTASMRRLRKSGSGGLPATAEDGSPPSPGAGDAAAALDAPAQAAEAHPSLAPPACHPPCVPADGSAEPGATQARAAHPPAPLVAGLPRCLTRSWRLAGGWSISEAAPALRVMG